MAYPGGPVLHGSTQEPDCVIKWLLTVPWILQMHSITSIAWHGLVIRASALPNHFQIKEQTGLKHLVADWLLPAG